MNYAVIKTGGKQYKISEGNILDVDRLPQKKDQEMVFKEVLLASIDGKIEIGKPYLESVMVSAKIMDEIRGVKVRVAKFKAKSRYRRATGFRAELTKIKIEKIMFSSGKVNVEKLTLAKIEKKVVAPKGLKIKPKV